MVTAIIHCSEAVNMCFKASVAEAGSSAGTQAVLHSPSKPHCSHRCISKQNYLSRVVHDRVSGSGSPGPHECNVGQVTLPMGSITCLGIDLRTVTGQCGASRVRRVLIVWRTRIRVNAWACCRDSRQHAPRDSPCTRHDAPDKGASLACEQCGTTR